MRTGDHDSKYRHSPSFPRSGVSAVTRIFPAFFSLIFLFAGAGFIPPALWAQESATTSTARAISLPSVNNPAPGSASNSPPLPTPSDKVRQISIGLAQEPAPAPAAPPAWTSAPASFGPGRRYAVIIGINQYKNSDLNLNFCVPDARLIYDLLTDPARGGVPKENARLLYDSEATRLEIERAFEDLLAKVTPDDMVFIYYSGHGAPGPNDLFFWVTHDADLDRLRTSSLSNARIGEFLHDVQANRMVQFLDCCYSLGTVTGRAGALPMPDGDPFSGIVSQGRLTFTATSGREKAIELSRFGHGAFTYFLADGLKGGADTNFDGWVDADEAWSHLNAKVTYEAQQQGNPQHPYRFGASTFGLRLTRDPTVGERLGPAESGLEILFRNGSITKLEYDEARRLVALAPGGPFEADRTATLRLATGDITPDQWRRLLFRNRTGSEGAAAATPSAPEATPPPLPTPPPTLTPAPPTPSPTPQPTPVVRFASPWSKMPDVERLRLLADAIEKMYMDTGQAPVPGTNWHRALVENTGAPGWSGPYIGISADYPPIDRWNTPIVYEQTKIQLPGKAPRFKIKVISCGADGIYDGGLKNDRQEERTLRRK